AGRWVRRFGRRLLVGALVLFVLGVAGAGLVAATLAGTVGNGTFVAVLAVPLFVAGLGGGGVLTPNQALSYVDVDARSGSTAGGSRGARRARPGPEVAAGVAAPEAGTG